MRKRKASYEQKNPEQFRKNEKTGRNENESPLRAKAL